MDHRSRPARNHSPLIIWRLLDGKPGHENQSAGLAAALSERVAADSFEIDVSAPRFWAGEWLRGTFTPGESCPDPDLIIGAGHATHLPMLAARRARGGRTVVQMRPTLPLRLFDLCLIPEHDNPPQRDNVVATRGVLNRIRPGTDKDSSFGLILIGGPSRHHRWSNAAIMQQVNEVAAATPEMSWTLTTSRRTPGSFVAALEQKNNVTIVSWEQTDANWVPQQLARAARVWVTVDSVSMIFEALTAGAAVGVMSLPVVRDDRVTRSVQTLVEAGRVTVFGQWQTDHRLAPPTVQLDEAGRCAEIILARWFGG